MGVEEYIIVLVWTLTIFKYVTCRSGSSWILEPIEHSYQMIKYDITRYNK